MKKTIVVSRMITTLMTVPLLAADDGHGHAVQKALSVDELFTVECECKVPQYTCEECRYELGLVKIDSSLVNVGEKKGGLFKIEPVTRRAAQALLSMNGEIGLNANTQARVAPRVSGLVRCPFRPSRVRASKKVRFCSKSKVRNSGARWARIVRTGRCRRLR